MKIPKFDWKPFDRKNPPIDLHQDEAYLILLREDNHDNGTSWHYSVDIATPYEDYIDNFWFTNNDWLEGQRVEVIAYAELPYFINEDDLEEKDD